MAGVVVEVVVNRSLHLRNNTVPEINAGGAEHIQNGVCNGMVFQAVYWQNEMSGRVMVPMSRTDEAGGIPIGGR